MLRSVIIISVLCTAKTFADRDRHDHEHGANNGFWNPFNQNFDFSNVRGAPEGFGQFPSFGNGGLNGFGSNNNFGFANPGFGNSGFSSGAFPQPSFTDFSKNFADFQKQFGSFGGVTDAPATMVTTESADIVRVPVPVTTTSTTTTTSTATIQSTSTIGQVINNNNQGRFMISNRNCTTEGVVIGISPSSTDPCGSTECECFKGMYICYSTCSAPPANQTCDVVVSSGGNVCPQYSNCGPLVNASTMGNSNIFRCDARTPSVHPSICWLYEILFGKLTEPLGFFESVADGCTLASQCTCSSGGFVQPTQFKQDDFKMPANNAVFTRAHPGNRGVVAAVSN